MFVIAMLLPPVTVVKAALKISIALYFFWVFVFKRFSKQFNDSKNEVILQRVLSGHRLVSPDGLTEAAFDSDSQTVMLRRNDSHGHPRRWYVVPQSEIFCVRLLAQGSDEERALVDYKDGVELPKWYMWAIVGVIVGVMLPLTAVCCVMERPELAVAIMLPTLIGGSLYFRFYFRKNRYTSSPSSHGYKLVFYTRIPTMKAFAVNCRESDGRQWLAFFHEQSCQPVPPKPIEGEALVAASSEHLHNATSVFWKSVTASTLSFMLIIACWYIWHNFEKDKPVTDAVEVKAVSQKGV